ncbi:LytTR family DNA-binding domain-containing protein [Clostridium cylindrosporum]|uniref:Transcriptional regulator, LytTR family n=1 Tax=Clostridium cylindrosporum DSM 605 TaxID=1121307 RepID=A0A0J8DDR6_CLOCY|nr:LytTR family DNA-binding domain-containing protein [Clostridium cylindrosporum]KMT22379.1 transcriptional regulator, LytTR family [Clostridium cylindrosporum DSM 605]
MKLIIDQSLENKELEITIKCNLIDPKLEKLISQIRLYFFSIVGRKDGESFPIQLEDVYYFESIDDKTFTYCEKTVYECDLKLYELENQLGDTSFIRISKSCILNTLKLKSVKALLNGKMEASLLNGEKQIINRHYVKAIKRKLNI